MDITLNQIVAWGASLLIGIGAVSAFLAKYSGKAKKAVFVAKESIDLLDATLKSIEDGKVDDIEVAKIRDEVNQLMTAIKALKS